MEFFPFLIWRKQTFIVPVFLLNRNNRNKWCDKLETETDCSVHKRRKPQFEKCQFHHFAQYIPINNRSEADFLYVKWQNELTSILIIQSIFFKRQSHIHWLRKLSVEHSLSTFALRSPLSPQTNHQFMVNSSKFFNAYLYNLNLNR